MGFEHPAWTGIRMCPCAYALVRVVTLLYRAFPYFHSDMGLRGPLRPISEGDEIQANDSPFAARERPDASRTGCLVGSALPHRPCLPGPRAASSVRPRRPCYRATSTALKLWTNRGLADKRSLCQLAEAALLRTSAADAAGKPVSHCARPPDPQQSQPIPRARPAR
jgi:hypothetical protein